MSTANNSAAPKLARPLTNWQSCEPLAMATKQSAVAIQFAFEDARHDILLLAALNAELIEALRRCRFDSLNMSLADLEFCRAVYVRATGAQQ